MINLALLSVTIKIKDMHCRSCEQILESTVRRLSGVHSVKAIWRHNSLEVTYDSAVCSLQMVQDAVRQAGYRVGEPERGRALGMVFLITAVIWLGKYTVGADIDTMLQQPISFFMLFVIGALTSLHCIGMCGGIMVSQTIGKGNSSGPPWQAAVLYNSGRLLSYGLTGGIVGALGSIFAISLSVKAGITIFAGCFMMLMGINLLGFKLPVVLPTGLRTLISTRVKAQGPFAVGLLNGLLPCGPLQTMQVFALGSGSAASGAAAMLLFGLGTMPLMLPLGVATSWMSSSFTGRVLKASGIMVIMLGVIMANRGLAIAGIHLPGFGVWQTNAVAHGAPIKAEIKDGTQVVRIAANDKGYVPNIIVVQKDLPVKWIVEGQQINSCNNEIIVPSLHIQTKLRQGENSIEFTPGDGDIRFSCWMGMIQGLIKVVDNLETTDISKLEALPAAGGCCSGGTCGMGADKRPSIYGDDFSKVPTNRLIHKASIAGEKQTISIKGIGYEFEPLVAVIAKGKPVKFVFELTEFDSPEGKFEIIEGVSKKTLISFPGNRGTTVVQFTPVQSGSYGIFKNGNVMGVIEVVEDVTAADLENVRVKLF